MKQLGFRASDLSTEENADAGTKPSQITGPQLFYIVYYVLISLKLIFNILSFYYSNSKHFPSLVCLQ